MIEKIVAFQSHGNPLSQVDFFDFLSQVKSTLSELENLFLKNHMTT